MTLGKNKKVHLFLNRVFQQCLCTFYKPYFLVFVHFDSKE